MRVKCDHQSVYRMENETNLKPIAQIATVSICFFAGSWYCNQVISV